jgi:anti-sigma regulatory factor (Ser/Thr protein kinase)
VRELALHVLDVLENAIEAGASWIELTIREDSAEDRLTIEVVDNGRGIDDEGLSRVGDPFFTTRTTRRVGLGIPLLRAAARRCNGDLTIESRPGAGTRVCATFQRSHVDRAPLGDMRSTLLGVLLSEREINLRYQHRVDNREFAFDTADMREALQGVPLSHPAVRAWLEAFLAEGFDELYQRASPDHQRPATGS